VQKGHSSCPTTGKAKAELLLLLLLLLAAARFGQRVAHTGELIHFISFAPAGGG
jgi:hypothetical protein